MPQMASSLQAQSLLTAKHRTLLSSRIRCRRKGRGTEATLQTYVF